MRKLLYILASASFWWPATAAAQHHHHHKPHHHATHQAQVAESYAPTLAELAHARTVAVAYWHVELSPPLSVLPLPVGVGGEADWWTGAILLTASYDWRDFPEELCGIYVHEYGHLVLGPNYFAAVNPSDPMHSPDPNNIMYGGGEHGAPFPTYPQRFHELQSVGCYMGP